MSYLLWAIIRDIRTVGYLMMINFKNNPKRTHSVIRSTSYPVRSHVTELRESKKPKRTKLLFVIPIVILGLFVSKLLFFGHTNTPDTSLESSVTSKPVKPDPIKELDFTEMGASINKTISENPGMDIGVSIVDCKTGRPQDYGVQKPFVAASTAKLITALAFLYDVEHGKASLDQPIGKFTAEQALEALIVDSDNQVWDIFNNTIMNHQELAEYAGQIGLTGYNPDGNTITPASVAMLLNNLFNEKLLNAQHTRLVLSYMERAKEIDFITKVVPADTKVYHKPGFLDDRVHDAAILDNGKRPYVLVIFTKSRTVDYDSRAGEKVFADITRATLDTFNR